jgi:hypothetical protein
MRRDSRSIRKANERNIEEEISLPKKPLPGKEFPHIAYACFLNEARTPLCRVTADSIPKRSAIHSHVTVVS